jgi:hypothetical protein
MNSVEKNTFHDDKKSLLAATAFLLPRTKRSSTPFQQALLMCLAERLITRPQGNGVTNLDELSRATINRSKSLVLCENVHMTAVTARCMLCFL